MIRGAGLAVCLVTQEGAVGLGMYRLIGDQKTSW